MKTKTKIKRRTENLDRRKVGYVLERKKLGVNFPFCTFADHHDNTVTLLKCFPWPVK